MFNKDKNELKYLVGNNRFSNRSTLPFNDNVCEFLNDFSTNMIANKNAKKYPDIITLAFWCRKKNIYNLKNKFIGDEIRVGLGLIFHITPSNIPTNFAYSLIFGLITGNSNIVKVPSQKFEQVTIICETINKVLKKKKFKRLKKMINIVKYQNDDARTKVFSSVCDARLIWGGDKSINNIRKFPIKEKSIDLTFADRFSFCVMDSQKILKLKKNEIETLVKKFYNDTYLVDQNACSSPHLVIWLGKNYNAAKEIFWKSLFKYAKQKYILPETASVEKYTQLCENILSLSNFKNYKSYKNLIYTVLLKNLNKNIHNLRGKWGFFYEYNTNDLNEIKKFLNKKYQTLTYFGLNKDLIKNFVSNGNLSGIDRIVPVGQALDISLVWDGYDLNKILSRVIEVR